MQTLKLIGWPSASGRGTWQIIGKSDLSTIILSGTTGNLGDITGKGTGAARAARAVGVGEDEEIRRAARELDLLARSAWVGELIASERSLGAALMLLAGGREFLAGMGVRLNGNGMAPRAARYLKDKRGRVPSDTSLEEAAATAAAAMVARIPSFESGMDCGLGFEVTAARLRESAGLRSHFAGVAWRAAFHSLDGDMGDGTTGRQAAQHFVGVSLALQAGQLESQRASLEAWARGERIMEDTADATARRAVCSWVWRSLVPARAPGANAARARDCARQRARFLIRLVHGNPWADAARLAGFADGAAAAKVLAARRTWAALARAAVAESGAHPLAAALRRAWWRAARLEVKARRAARVWVRTTATRGARRAAARGLVTPGGAVLVQHSGARRIARTTAGRVATFLDKGGVPVFARDHAARVSRKVRALAVDIGAAARRALDKREQAARATTGAAARLVAFQARAAQSWERASKGLRRGFMQ